MPVPSSSSKKENLARALFGRSHFSGPTVVLSIVLLAGTFGVYSRALKHSFVNYDDPDYVTENVHVQQGLSVQTLGWALSSTDAANWHPVTWVSHALDCELFGLDAEGHHFTSIFLHCLNALLVFLLLKRATGKILSSWMVAALFTVHPINVECVAWVAERKSVLCMFFLLLSIAAYGWYARKPSRGRYVFMASLYALALMAKPMAVTFPFMLMLLDVWPLHRVEEWFAPSDAFPVEQLPAKRLVYEKVWLIAMSAASCVVTLVAQRPAMKTVAAVPFSERLANAIYSYVVYLRNTVWPAHLGVFYAPMGAGLQFWQIAGWTLFLIAFTALVWRFRSRSYLPVGWFWFLGTLVPMIGIVQVGEQGMADRYAYLPLLGIFALIIFGVAELCEGSAARRWIATVTAILALAAFSFVAWRQISTWESSYSLWSHSLGVTKENYVAEDYVGYALLESGSESSAQGCVEALVHFRRAVAINPQDMLGHLNVGFCEQTNGQLREAEQEYETVAQFSGSRFLRNKAYMNLGSVFEQMGDIPKARFTYEGALQIFPNDRALIARLRSLDSAGSVTNASK